MAVEMPNAASDYAVVFAQSEDVVMPAVILGLQAQQNLYLTESGAWQAGYIPAFIRRYPFVFSSSDDGKQFTLCIDEAFPGFNKEGKGQRLFNDEKKPTEYVQEVLKFLQHYQAQFQRTKEFGKKLKELDLLEPMQAQLTLGSGEKMSLTGFSVVDRKKLKALPAQTLAELAKTDELELVYLHLHSMRNFNILKDRISSAKAGIESGAVSDKAEDPELATTE